MVQVLRAAQRRPNKGRQIAQSISQSLMGGLELYAKHQKGKEFGDALKSVEDIYSNKDLSDQQKLVSSYRRLAQHNPDIADKLVGHLSRTMETPLQGAQRKKILSDIEQSEGENSYFKRLMSGDENAENDQDYGMGEDEGGAPLDVSGRGNAGENGLATSQKAKNPGKFNADDPESWSPKQINSFRAYQGNNAKGKTFARLAQNEYERRQDVEKKTTAYKTAVAPFENALSTLDKMKKIGKRGSLGFGTSLSPFASTQKDAAEYSRLGKSLISLASTIPIRNEKEFEVLSNDLFDPTLTDAKREGILSAMEKIIRSSMEGLSMPEGGASGGAATGTKNRPSLQSFYK